MNTVAGLSDGIPLGFAVRYMAAQFLCQPRKMANLHGAERRQKDKMPYLKDLPTNHANHTNTGPTFVQLPFPHLCSFV